MTIKSAQSLVQAALDVINTIDDCLAKAKNPANINFGVCLQFDQNPEKKYRVSGATLLDLSAPPWR